MIKIDRPQLYYIITTSLQTMYEEVAEKLKGKRKVILVHGNADMDAVGSAYAISRCFPSADIYAPNGVDRVSKVVSDKLGMDILLECDPSTYDMAVVVDTSSPEQFGMEVNLPADTLVIDHHIPTGKWEYELICDTEKVACTQVVLDIIRENRIDIDKDIALALLGGMLTDSGHFQYADAALLRDFAYLMETTGVNMDEAMTLTHTDISMSERVSVMKCIERSKFDRVGDMIVATSYSGSYEAAGCRALLQAGADVVFVASQRDENFRLSARATQPAVRRGINLAEMVKDIGQETVTDGGGHDGAAGISGIGDIEAMLHICMQRTMDEFRRIKKENEGDMPSDDE